MGARKVIAGAFFKARCSKRLDLRFQSLSLEIAIRHSFRGHHYRRDGSTPKTALWAAAGRSREAIIDKSGPLAKLAER